MPPLLHRAAIKGEFTFLIYPVYKYYTKHIRAVSKKETIKILNLSFTAYFQEIS